MRAALARERQPERGAGPEDGQGTDAALLARLAAGDKAAFAVLVGRHLPSVLAIARRMLRDEAEAEDMAQEALIRLWRNAGTVEVGPAGVRPWLRRVVANLCIDRVRAGRATEVTDEVPETPEAPTQQRRLEQQDLAARVDRALSRLPDRQRQALVLFHYEGLSQVEVGRMLGVSDEAVESLLSRARRALKATLQDDWRQLMPDEESQP